MQQEHRNEVKARNATLLISATARSAVTSLKQKAMTTSPEARKPTPSKRLMASTGTDDFIARCEHNCQA